MAFAGLEWGRAEAAYVELKLTSARYSGGLNTYSGLKKKRGAMAFPGREPTDSDHQDVLAWESM